jgi:hypothetical protein
MKRTPLLTRRIAVVGAMALVALRTGPLAPVKVMLTQAVEGA